MFVRMTRANSGETPFWGTPLGQAPGLACKHYDRLERIAGDKYSFTGPISKLKVKQCYVNGPPLDNVKKLVCIYVCVCVCVCLCVCVYKYIGYIQATLRQVNI